MRILSVDTGGTKVRLAVASPAAQGFDLTGVETYSSASYASLDQLIRHYLDRNKVRVDTAGIAVAGPVVKGTAALTNLPWEVSAAALADALSFPVALLNDLEGLAWSIPMLPADAVATLQSGDAGAHGNQALIAAGTGLGQAILFDTADGYRPSATEGGHCDFAAADADDFELYQYLAEQYEHVSWERVLSGPGLATLYRFLLHRTKTEAPDWFAGLEERDQPAAVSRQALDNSDPLAVEAMQRFVVFYAREAANLALKAKSTGGLYIGGGIAPKILPALRRPVFVETFNAKGRMRPLLSRMPVRVILDETAALSGIARYAQHHAVT